MRKTKNCKIEKIFIVDIIIYLQKQTNKQTNKKMNVDKTYFEMKIDEFMEINVSEYLRPPLEKIIQQMLRICMYKNGESLERHNWGYDKLQELVNIPELPHKNNNTYDTNYENTLLKALDEECNQKSIIELLWGDVQLGKRVHACIIMWVSIHILHRPVLYIFRNLNIDKKQLVDDISGTDDHNFNIKYIKKIFYEIVDEKIRKNYTSFTLTPFIDITKHDIESFNDKNIYCCLMNPTQLLQINNICNNHISKHNTLVNITLLIDESDLICPTSSNDGNNINDIKDTTQCEKLISTICKKVHYALHITGTAHSLLSNITTTISENCKNQVKISKIHKMECTDDYFGIFTDKITFNTDVVKECVNNYNINDDYNTNLKPVINIIYKRENVKYNSLLISEEKIISKHNSLAHKIIKDYHDLFVIVFNGECLTLYIPTNYIELYKEIFNHNIKPIHHDNIYSYYKITAKNNITLKYIYKTIRMLFVIHNNAITNKTVITISGKYSERGYSFTSDDYNEYSMHLTDQYYVSHSTYNCTNMSQQLRLQGKYNDIELQNGTMKLTLWTTYKFMNIIKNFYIPYTRRIEENIMEQNGWEEIKKYVETIIFKNNIKFIVYIGNHKNQKNIGIKQIYDKKSNGYCILGINIDDLDETDIHTWCKSQPELPIYNGCINEIKVSNKDEFIDKYGKTKAETITNRFIVDTDYRDIEKTNKELNNIITEKINSAYKIIYTEQTITTIRMMTDEEFTVEIDKKINKGRGGNKGNHRQVFRLTTNNKIEVCFIIYTGEKKELPISSTNYSKDSSDNNIVYKFIDNTNNTVKYSKLKHGYVYNESDKKLYYNNIPCNEYYWKSIDSNLYLCNGTSKEFISVYIIDPPKSELYVNQLTDNTTTTLEEPVNCIVKDFAESRFIENSSAEGKTITFIYDCYKDWCNTNKKQVIKNKNLFEKEFSRIYKKQIGGKNRNKYYLELK